MPTHKGAGNVQDGDFRSGPDYSYGERLVFRNAHEAREWRERERLEHWRDQLRYGGDGGYSRFEDGSGFIGKAM
ncbi:MAG: hypothetical protein M3Z23_12480 [Acidobacteriota bacterium]|nr:hypothetical protein [Acidobacteriota bacterium]